MTPKTLITVVALAPFVALLAGVGILAMRIGDTWTETTTASLVTGLTAVCGGGTVVIGILVALIVGIPMATRYFAEAGVARRAWGDAPRYLDAPQYRALPPAGAWREETPPMLTDRQGQAAGSWHSSGPASYELWEQSDDDKW